MPFRLDTHVLTVDANVIHKVDTGNPANLHSMWAGKFSQLFATSNFQCTVLTIVSVFSRCAESVDQGRRLENISWRLWQRAQLVGKHSPFVSATRPYHTSSQALPKNIPYESRLPELPQLSGSVESAIEDETEEFTSVSAPLEMIRPRIQRLDSSTISRSKRDRHISSDDFEKMVMSIVQDKAPLSVPVHNSPFAHPSRHLPLKTTPAFERSGSTTTESQSPSKGSEGQSEFSEPSPGSQPRTNVVRGFSPSQYPAAQASQQSNMGSAPHDMIPEPKSSPAPKMVFSKKQPTKFALGASCSSSELSQSLDVQKIAPITATKRSVFQVGASSEDDGSLKSAFQSKPASLLRAEKKQASFSNQVSTRMIPSMEEAAVDSDTDYVDESAIDDDDDSSDWEDSVADSGKSSVDDKFFKRVDSKANLTSRPSLITLMLAQNDRVKTLSNQASHSTSAIPRTRLTPQTTTLGASPNDSDEAPLMMKDSRQTQLRSIAEVPRSNAQPIAAAPTRIHAQAALSPRTTRRNMLATELTESLRRHLLWERQQKSSTANAVLRRRHTSQDVANLKQYPEKACMNRENDDTYSWNQYFSKDTLNGYHSKGW